MDARDEERKLGVVQRRGPNKRPALSGWKLVVDDFSDLLRPDGFGEPGERLAERIVGELFESKIGE